MTLRDSVVVAFDGTHSSGKTTLIYAVAAALRSRGVHVVPLGEPARTSPFVDDVVVHKAGHFDMLLELDIFAAHMTNCLRAARSYSVVLADKTLTNVLAYCKMLVQAQPGSWDDQMINVMDKFCASWGEAYDAVFYTQDSYDTYQHGDIYRSEVAHLQAEADLRVRAEYERLRQELILIPKGLVLSERTNWVVRKLEEKGLISEGVGK
jgi:predicted ATPase